MFISCYISHVLNTNNPSFKALPSERNSFSAFRDRFLPLPVITLPEIRMHFPSMHRSRLSEWQRKGLLLKLRNGAYRLTERPVDEGERWAIANQIYPPSYVSLRSALAYHGFIPEGIFHVESISTNHTKRFTIAGTDYSYRNVGPERYFGYTFLEAGTTKVRVMMARPEKALLDLLYLDPGMAGPGDFEAWRLDASGILASIDMRRMDDFALLMRSKALLARYGQLKAWLHDNA